MELMGLEESTKACVLSNDRPFLLQIQLTSPKHPHLTPKQAWEHLFDPTANPYQIGVVREGGAHQSFIPSTRPAYLEILSVLAENDPDTVTLVAVGPLTNLALAAASEPEVFLRVKEVVVMGGAVNVPGNVSFFLGPKLAIWQIHILTFQLCRSPQRANSTHMPMPVPLHELRLLRPQIRHPRYRLQGEHSRHTRRISADNSSFAYFR